MSLTKQAKILTQQQQNAVLSYLTTTRHPDRNKVIFMLSFKAALRAKEIAAITWGMVTNSDGELTDAISLENSASKGKSGGVVYLHKDLKIALQTLKNGLESINLSETIIQSERLRSMSAQVVVNLLFRWYRKMGFDGCSSHSGRRSCITNAAKKISSVGGSMRDVQAIARHKSLQMTQKYIEMDVDAQKRVMQVI